MENITINKLYRDDLDRISGIFLIDKPVGITSHDVVDKVRKIFKTKAVGHAGTLDPFASGLLIILVGKATKKSDEFMGFDKSYLAEIAFGVSTDSHDPEGNVQEDIEVMNRYGGIDEFNDDVKKSINSFVGKTMQAVPVFSSVKINGDKLRELARKYERFELEDLETSQKISFYSGNEKKKEVEVSKREITIPEIKVTDFKERKFSIKEQDFTKLAVTVDVSCSKGTYIRQLAYDIGQKFDMPSMLINLRRTRIGEYKVEDALTIEQLVEQFAE